MKVIKHTYLNKPEVVKQLITQIEKDFDLAYSGIFISDDPEMIYEALLNQLEPIVSKLIVGNYQKLLQLLYRIDINEKLISETINNPQTTNLAGEITKLVIMRELQKVITRNLYKS